MKTILHTVHIHASPGRVFEALTTEVGLRGWWTTEATVAPGEGGVIAFTFHGDFHPRMEQTRLVPGELVEWTCIAGHANWQDNDFTFLLRERDGDTSLRFVQEYAQELDDDTYGTYNYNWGYYLGSLKRLCEGGEGTPYRPAG